MSDVPVKVKGRHVRECPDRHWRITGGFEWADERGRKLRDPLVSLRKGVVTLWLVAQCDGCNREALIRGIWLDWLVEDATAKRSSAS